MSHLNSARITVTDLDLLRKTIAGFSGLKWNEGCRLHDGKKTFRSYYCHEKGGSSGKALEDQIAAVGTLEHSISIDCRDGNPNHYEIGVVRKKDGEGYVLVFDGYDSMAAAIVGHNCEKVMSAYAEVTIREEYERRGFIVEESIDEHGAKILTAIVPD